MPRSELTPAAAASVIVVREARGGPQVLLLCRSEKLSFAGGMSVFPGGRVEASDAETSSPSNTVLKARLAAVREAREECRLALAEGDLIPFAHWTPPTSSLRPFDTWFFIGSAQEDAHVVPDGVEIVSHQWIRPAVALERREAGEIRLMAPTWLALWRLSAFPTAAEALRDARRRRPQAFAPRHVEVPGGRVALYAEDSSYGSGDLKAAGPRHRLWMLDDGWRYEFHGFPADVDA